MLYDNEGNITPMLMTEHKYNVATLVFVGWTTGDNSETSHDGYNAYDYFDADGTYRGPDEFGIEPLVEHKP